MSKLAYIIFLMPFATSAMLPSQEQAFQAKRIIAVANILKQGVVAEIDDTSKAWICKGTIGLLEVFPLKSPRLLHTLLICDTDEAQQLADHCFEHPDCNETYMVYHTGDLARPVSIKKVTPDDLPNYGKQQPGSQLFCSTLQKQAQ